MIFGIITTYLVIGFVVGLLSKESEFDEGWRVLLWFIGWPVLGIIVNRREDVVACEMCETCVSRDSWSDLFTTCPKCKWLYPDVYSMHKNCQDLYEKRVDESKDDGADECGGKV